MKAYIVIVKQPDILTPRVYRVVAQYPQTDEQLIAAGANIVPERGDVVTTEAVSDALASIVDGRWLEVER